MCSYSHDTSNPWPESPGNLCSDLAFHLVQPTLATLSLHKSSSEALHWFFPLSRCFSSALSMMHSCLSFFSCCCTAVIEYSIKSNLRKKFVLVPSSRCCPSQRRTHAKEACVTQSDDTYTQEVDASECTLLSFYPIWRMVPPMVGWSSHLN